MHASTILCLQDTQEKLIGNEWKKMYPVNSKHKKVEVAKLRSNKVNFMTETIIRDKKGNLIITDSTWKVQQSHMTEFQNA